MNKPLSTTRYNQRIPHMEARESTRTPSGLRLGWLTSFLLATVFLPSSLCASGLGDTARQLAHKIAAAAGPGAFALEVTNRSSLDDKSVREVRSALEAELHVEGVHATKPSKRLEQSRSYSPRACANTFGRLRLWLGPTRKRSPWSRCRGRQLERPSPPLCRSF